MKIFILLLTITLLASCTTQESEIMTTKSLDDNLVEDTIKEIE